MAGEIRRAMNFEDPSIKKESESNIEQKILLQAIYNSNEPKFISADLIIFENLLKNLFPEKESNAKQDEKAEFIMAIDAVMDKMNLDKLSYFVEKIS